MPRSTAQSTMDAINGSLRKREDKLIEIWIYGVGKTFVIVPGITFGVPDDASTLA
jgi:hypothetical protein